jgi:hypothetical protein
MTNSTADSLVIVPDGTDQLKLEHLVRHYRIFEAESPKDTITKGVIVLKAEGLALDHSPGTSTSTSPQLTICPSCSIVSIS